MIKFRPHRSSIKASIREERFFETKEEMLQHVFDRWSRVLAYVGAEPLKADEIQIDSHGRENRLSGYMNEHTVTIRQRAIGFCEE